eukprot:CAMPEP_0116878690 /NCGR_PEP_ID=MMETSP0463-20121206/10439_1 /TAXON_ID=181622 /ORGANISM="Strombidinopsis sp, Strain SopsisLIS2011" /LENGTH=55 /DNA_ID=CAMNT_0004527161 /DNA_START=2513 /DNA_END=2680 /DNA_ORIENTATION=-
MRVKNNAIMDEPIYYQDLNFTMMVKKNKPLVNELKKVGVIIDRGNRLELRPDDLV